jgi:Tfp pilus assembly protein PilW
MNKQTGYTLIELLLYVAITAILLSALMAFFAMSLSGRVKSESIGEVDQQGSFILDTVTQALRNADSITAPAAGASASSLTLAMATSAINPTVFSLSGNTMQVKEGTANAVPMSTPRVKVTALTFKNLSRSGTPGSIQVVMTLSTVNTTGRSEYDYQKTFTTSVSLR